MKKLISLILIVVLVLSLCIPVFAEFEDVPETHWAYSTIEKMVEKGLIQGMGNNSFAPDQPMTRAQFITILMRYLYPEETAIAESKQGQFWWSNTEDLAREKGLINNTEWVGQLDKDCSRQEMAHLLINACNLLGEDTSNMVDIDQIPDLDQIGTAYRADVRKTMYLGLITGMDEKHTFSPLTSMNRAQASVVLYRLTEPSKRESFTPTQQQQQQQTNEYGNIILSTKPSPKGTVTTDRYGRTIDDGQKVGIYNWSTLQDFTRNNVKFKEGSQHPIPMQGDIVVKEDGTEVVIDYLFDVDASELNDVEAAKGVHWCGILRAKGCDIWTGATFVNAQGEIRVIGIDTNLGFFAGDGGAFRKGLNGECYTGDMWNLISMYPPSKPNISGSYDGQVDETGLYYWDAETNTWRWYGG